MSLDPFARKSQMRKTKNEPISKQILKFLAFTIADETKMKRNHPCCVTICLLHTIQASKLS